MSKFWIYTKKTLVEAVISYFYPLIIMHRLLKKYESSQENFWEKRKK